MTERLTALTDDELMDHLARGEMEPLGELFLRHGPLVRNALQRHAPSLSQAELEELGQEVFLAVEDSARRYRPQDRFQSWLYGVALRKARESRRRKALRRRLLRAHQAELACSSAGALASPEKTALLREQVAAALAGLPAKQREVLMLSAGQGHSAEEIAQILGLKPGAVWTRLHRARQTLLAEMEAREKNGDPGVRGSVRPTSE